MLNGKSIGECYNFSTNHPLRVIEIIEEISRLMGRTDLSPVIQNQATNEIPDQFLDGSKASKELGWSPHYTLEEGLRETIAWYQEFLDDDAARREK